jgi:hypothetical protein
VHREVTHPLEVGHHPQGGDQHPQVAGDGLLQREQLERPVLHALAGRVDVGVVADDPFGDRRVGGQQRLGRAGDGLLHLVGHRHQVVDDRVELVEVGVAHGRHGTEPRCPPGDRRGTR